MSQAEKDALFAIDAANSTALAVTLNAITNEQLLLSEKVGAIKATSFIKKLVTVTEIKLIAEIKETNVYKGLKIIDQDGELVTVTTWDQFCKSIGQSREHIDENIRNLSAFGQDFLETSQRMGVGYRDLRRLRQINEEDREFIINGEAVQAGDKDSLIELIEDMSVKHSKVKSKLESQVKDLNAEAKAKDRVIESKQSVMDLKNSAITSM